MYLVPDRPAINETVIGVVGRGQKRHRVRIHGVAFVSNHFHMVVTGANPEQIARFMQYVKGNLTRRINRLRGRTGTLWQGRYDMVRVPDDSRQQAQALAYVLAHGAKEGLVARPEQWPGVSSAAELLCGGRAATGYWQRREAMGRTTAKVVAQDPERFREAHAIKLSPLPGLAAFSEEEQQEQLRVAVDAVIASHRSGTPDDAGAERAKRHDWQRKAGDGNTSTERARSDGVAGKPTDFRAAFDEIAAWYRAASSAFLAGDAAVFPPWTFPPSLRMGGPDGLAFGEMNRRTRREWAQRQRTGVYRNATGPPEGG